MDRSEALVDEYVRLHPPPGGPQHAGAYPVPIYWPAPMTADHPAVGQDAPQKMDRQLMSKLKDFTNKKYPTDADLDAFCQEHFRTVRKQFGDGLSRQRKVVELFDRATEADVIAGLRKDGHGEELQSFLEARIQTVPGYTGPAVEPPAQPTSAQPGLPAGVAPILITQPPGCGFARVAA